MNPPLNIVVTGSTGQLGMSFKAALKEWSTPHHVKFLNRKKLNLSRLSSIQKLYDYDFDILINTAAYTAVDKAEQQQQRCARINALAMEEMAAICAKKKALLVHYSTDYVYHNDLRRPLLEDDPKEPKNTYGITKLLGEKLLRAILRNHIIIRSSWIYSEYGHNFVKTMLRLAETRNEISVVHDQIGAPTYAKDLATYTLKLLDYYIAADNPQSYCGTYNFANAGETSWHGFAEEIFRQRGLAVHVTPIPSTSYPTPALRPAYSVMDCSKFAHAVKSDIPEWKEALARCMHALK